VLELLLHRSTFPDPGRVPGAPARMLRELRTTARKRPSSAQSVNSRRFRCTRRYTLWSPFDTRCPSIRTNGYGVVTRRPLDRARAPLDHRDRLFGGSP
jgi:hypothetical protein